MAIPKFERFFRAAAGVDVDKFDLKRYDDFINDKIYDLVLSGRNHAKANGRDVMAPMDLPITKGLQESIQQFKKLDAEIGLEPILELLAARPPLDVTLGEETEAELPLVAGGVSVALARTFRIIDPSATNPSTEHWERAFRVFDLLL
jgi:hypothetical protein